MAIKENIQVMETPTFLAAEPKKSSRLFFIDHLRAALAILVVLHHVAMVYGASAPFYYVNPPINDLFAFVSLLVFALLNQGWFMGAFFLLAGYFTPGSYDRKGIGAFLTSRLVRLGIPLLLFYFVLSPLSLIGLFLGPVPQIPVELTWQSFWQMYPDLVGLGPLWFVALLFIFNIGYAAWRGLTGSRTSSTLRVSASPSMVGIGIFVLGLAAASYLMRMFIPIGKEVLDFPTLAYLPQYLSFFVIGLVASRRDWFRTMPSSLGVAGLVAAFAALVVLFPLAFSGQLFSVALSEAVGNAMGNGHWQSAVYALWDSIFAVGLSLGMITIFRGLFNRESRFGKFLSQHSYSVYIIHIPLIVFIAYAIRGIELGSLLKFGMLAVLVVPTCFIAAYLVRKIPLASRVL